MTATAVQRPRDASRRVLSSRDGFALGAILFVMIAVMGLVVGEPIFITLATVATALALGPIVAGKTSVFSPWGVVALNVLLSVFAQGVFIAFQYPNSEIIRELFLRGEGDSFFLWPTVLVAATIGVAAVAYFGGVSARVPPGFRGLDQPWEARRVLPLVATLAIVAAAATLAFVQATGGFTAVASSIKRTTIPGLELGTAYESYGHLRTLAALGRVALLLLAAHFFMQPGRLPARRWLALVVLLLIAVALPVYASSRSDALWILLEVSVIWFAAGRALDVKRLLVITLIVLMGFQIMTTARRSGESTTSAQLLSYALPGEAVVLTRNMLGIAKTAHVVNAVGDELQPKNGATIVAWVSAPIPRRIWRTKPLVEPGPEIGVKVYHTTRSGVPPGLVGDLYWNFGIGGVLAGSLILFFLIGRSFAALDPLRTKSPSRVVVYLAALFTPTWVLLSNGVGAALYTAALDGAVVLALVWVLRTRHPSKRAFDRSAEADGRDLSDAAMS